MKYTSLKLTCLCNDYVEEPHLLGEHGLSFLIETGKMSILFDTGQGMAIEHNAKQLNIDLGGVDAVVLSHGHYDHTGGLEKMLNYQDKVKVYCHPDIVGEKYRKLNQGKMRYIGIPRGLLKENKPNFIFHRKPLRINERILLTGQIPRQTPFEKVQQEFQVKSGSNWVKDNLLDDETMVIDTPAGLVLILGCTHSGLSNTLRYVAKITGKNNFFLIAGGTHLKGASKQKINKTITALGEFKIHNLILSHCTGIPAFCIIREALGKKVRLGKVGQVWQAPGQ